MLFKPALLPLLAALVTLLRSAEGEICAGCPIEFNPNTDNSNDWPKRIENSLNSINAAQPVHLVRITKATSQVVSGISYRFWVVTTVPGNANAVQNCELSYISQPWIVKEPQLTGENCTSPVNEVRSGKQLLGGAKDVQPSEMGTVRQLANFAVRTLDTIDTDDSKQVVGEIVNAKKQVVESECEEEAVTTRLGGLTRLNVNDGEVQKLAEKAVERYNMMTNCLTLAGLRNIIQASSQIVSGSNIYLTIEVADTDCTKNQSPNGKPCKIVDTNSDKHTVCDAVIWRKPGEKAARITSLDCKTEYYGNLPANYRNKRSAGMLGAPSEADPNSPYMQELAQFAVSQFARTNNADYNYFKVLRATSQVVSGMKVTIEMEMGKSDCSKSNSGCRVCSVTIWDQPWTKTRQIVDSDCYDGSRSAVSLVGGAVDIDPNDPELLAYANFISSLATDRLNSSYIMAVVKILRARTQVVSGYLVKLEVELADTDCPATENKDPSECNVVLTNGPAQICEMDILTQSWLNRTEVTFFDCSQTETRNGGRMVGEPYQISVDSPAVKRAAKFYLAEMDAQTNSVYRLGAGHIIRATNQIVSGSLTTITMQVGESKCLKNVETNDPCKAVGNTRVCTFTVFDQPWTKTTRIESQHCAGSPKKQKVRAGGIRPISTDDPSVKRLKPLVAERITQQTNSIYVQGIVSVIRASQQIVKGTVTRMTVEVGDTNCLKSEPRNDNSVCKVVPNNSGNHVICDVEVWDRPWLNEKEITCDCRNVQDQ